MSRSCPICVSLRSRDYCSANRSGQASHYQQLNLSKYCRALQQLQNMPPSTHQPHDPFLDAPLRPTTSNATSLSTNSALRTQTSQHSLRSNASTASARTRQQRDLFAPSLTRRGTTPRYEDEVLADSDSEQDVTAQRQKQTRRFRHGGADPKYGRNKAKQDEEQDFVNRTPDGSYLLGMAGFGETVTVPQMTLPKTDEEREQEGKSFRLHKRGRGTDTGQRWMLTTLLLHDSTSHPVLLWAVRLRRSRKRVGSGGV